MTERTSNGRVTGTFRGNEDFRSRTWTFTWTSPDGKRSFPVRLDRIAEISELRFNKGSGSVLMRFPRIISADPLAVFADRELRRYCTEEHNQNIEDWKSAEKEARAEKYELNWDVSCDLGLEYVTSEVISAVEYTNAHTGGAHGNSWTRTFTFWLNKNKPERASLSSLFRPGTNFSSTLSKLCIADLKRQDAAWIAAGEITELDAKHLSSFTLSPRGIKFIFDPYAVGSYSEGFYFVTIPFEKIADIADTHGPLRTLLPVRR